MKTSIREQLEQMLYDLKVRQGMLDKNIGEYVDAGNFGDAAINQIKRDTLTLVVSRIEEILK